MKYPLCNVSHRVCVGLDSPARLSRRRKGRTSRTQIAELPEGEVARPAQGTQAHLHGVQ